jgi:pantoate--beta-alanine ligase
MIVVNSVQQTRQWSAGHKAAGRKIGFVPTMGALHTGHIDLIERAARENDLSGCSIFVNPIQFNNPEDLAKYPRDIDRDLALLEKSGCGLVFVPSVEEMYPGPVKEKYDFGKLEKVMEGAHRPGHFNGVAVVVKRLFEIFQPDRAYFGEKDFQQLRIIQALVDKENIPVEIVPCPTVRETDGLAMSSRNQRLSPEERTIAPEIYKTLVMARDLAKIISVEEVKMIAAARLEHKGFKPDYFEIADSSSLQPVNSWDEAPEVIACIAAYLGAVRLIDNMILFSIFAR